MTEIHRGSSQEDILKVVEQLRDEFIELERRLLDDSKEELDKVVELYNKDALENGAQPIELIEVEYVEGCDRPALLVGPEGSEAQQLYEERLKVAADKDLINLLGSDEQVPIKYAADVHKAQSRYINDLKRYQEKVQETIDKIHLPNSKIQTEEATE